jgi:hypothetical protein
MDITYIHYIPMARGFVYLAVVLDWFSRRLLAWVGGAGNDCHHARITYLQMHIIRVLQGTSQFSGAALD